MLSHRRMPLIVVTFSAMLLGGCAPRDSGPPRRSSYPSTSLERWDDADWERVLGRVITDDGYVRYGPLIDNVDGVRDALYRHVGRINVASPANRPELFPTETDKLAYYLNTFNALSMYAALERDLPRNVWLSGVLHSAYFPIGGRRINLDQLENRIIRPFGDPRVHFALNWMSRSCPPLRREPYVGARLDEQLEDQGLKYLSDPRAVWAVDGDTIRLSELIASFCPQDFISTYERRTGVAAVSVIEAIQPYAAPDSPVQTATEYQRLPFDWSLNAVE